MAVVGRQIENRLAFPAHPAPLILVGDKAYPKDGSERAGWLSLPHLPWYLLLAAAEGQCTLLPLSTMEGPQPVPGSGATRHPRFPWLHPALLGHPQPPARGVPHGRGCAHPVCAMHSVPPAQLQVLSVRAHVRGVCAHPHARVPKCLYRVLLVQAACSPRSPLCSMHCWGVPAASPHATMALWDQAQEIRVLSHVQCPHSVPIPTRCPLHLHGLRVPVPCKVPLAPGPPGAVPSPLSSQHRT